MKHYFKFLVMLLALLATTMISCDIFDDDDFEVCIDTDSDGVCNKDDVDTDNDGVLNESDLNPLNPWICGDEDKDGCDDCSIGTDGFGPASDRNPLLDGCEKSTEDYYVILYEHSGKLGRYLKISLSDIQESQCYSLHRSEFYLFPDKASSLEYKLPTGVKFYLYIHDLCASESLPYLSGSGEIRDLKLLGFNDCLSSFKFKN